MKRLIVFLLFSISVFSTVVASPADPTMRKVIQPNGDTICISFHGDEFGSWYENDKGDIISRNNNGYWVYVSVENGNKILTNQIVSQTSMPIDINRDSIFNFIIQKRSNNYIEQKEISEGQVNSRTTTGELAPLPAIGVQKILTVLVQFTDVKFQNQTGIKNLVTNMMNQSNYKHPGQNNITGSLRDFYLQASYNQLDVRATVIGPYTVSHNMAYYGASTDNLKDIRRQELAQEVMEMIADDIDVSQFDNNNDGWVECIHILYAGNGNDEDKEIYSDAIWPHKWSLLGYVSADGVKMSRYMMTPEKYGNYYRGIGTVCHELGHILGAPDFYDTANNVFKGTGKWDLMAGGCWNSYINKIKPMNPAHPNPYIKTEIYGWASSVELLESNRLYTIPSSELYNVIYKLSTSTSGEYYLLENRQNTSLPGTGLVIYHVHSDISSSNINVEHPQKMYVVVANNHIAKPTGSVASYGTINSSNATFRSTNSKNIYFTSESLPSNCAWNGTQTQNKDVCFISEEMVNGKKCIKFVLNPEIEGPDILCDSAIYSLKHVPSNATVEWNYIRPAGISIASTPLFIGSGQGTKNICFTRGNSILGTGITPPPGDPILPIAPLSTYPSVIVKPYSGAVTIKADVIFNSDTFSLSKEIYMPEKVVIDDSVADSVWYIGETKNLFLKSPNTESVLDDIRWDIELPGESSRTIYGSSITLFPRAVGTATITATYIYGCDDDYKSETKSYLVKSPFSLNFVNPASGSVEIDVVGGGDTEAQQTMSVSQNELYMGAYRLELWHDVYGKVREMDVSENTPTVTMNLDGLSSGIYVLRLIIDNQLIETSQMIIR
ncbi:MAG: M6 family metalloprotease domain-containing protein [Paludibacteraceae bacterium]|nr:M6 family metalloprotease domain-containing protein [Paludibacteraceae bacterium]